MSFRRFGVGLVLIVTGVATKSAPAQTTAEARKGYDALAREFEQRVPKGDIAGLLPLYAANVTYVEADGSVEKGRAETENALKAGYQAMTIKSFTIHTTDFDSAGPLAYAAGTVTMAGVDKSTKKEMTQTTHFLLVVKQQPDKRWIV